MQKQSNMQGKDPKLSTGTVGCLWLLERVRWKEFATGSLKLHAPNVARYMLCRYKEDVPSLNLRATLAIDSRASAKMSCFPANLKVQGVSGEILPEGFGGMLACRQKI